MIALQCIELLSPVDYLPGEAKILPGVDPLLILRDVQLEVAAHHRVLVCEDVVRGVEGK